MLPLPLGVSWGWSAGRWAGIGGHLPRAPGSCEGPGLPLLCSPITWILFLLLGRMFGSRVKPGEVTWWLLEDRTGDSAARERDQGASRPRRWERQPIRRAVPHCSIGIQNRVMAWGAPCRDGGDVVEAEPCTYPSLELLTGQCWRKASQGSEVLSGLHRKVYSAFVPDEEGKKRKAMAHITWVRPACPSKACGVLTSHNH